MNKSWDYIRLDQLCDIRIGRTPRRDTPMYWGGTAVWVTISELTGGVISESKEHVSDLAVKEIMREPIPTGTLLFSFKLSIGKMGIAGCPLYTNEAIAALIIRDSNRLSRDFLKYSLEAVNHSIGANTAVLGKVLNKEKVSAIQIPLPPLPEQERIVRLLDEAEALRTKRTQANERMEDFVPALLQELFDTASNEIISNSNNDWKEMKLGDVCSFIRGPFGGSLKKNVFKSEGYAVYEQRHAIHKDYSEIRYFINEEKFKEMARFELHPGELIMSCSGVTLGRVSIAPENMKPGIINQALLKLTPSNKISAEFLKLWMESESFQVKIKNYSQGAAIPNVASVKILKDIPIYLPPLALQQEFAERVKEAREIQSAQGRSTERVEALYQSMLDRAFKGEL